MNFSTKLSLQFAAIFLAGLLAIGYLGYSSATGMVENSIREQLEYKAVHSMDKIDRMLFERYADITVLSTDPVLRSRSAGPEQIAERLDQYQNGYRMYSSLSVFDLGRTRIADTAGNAIGKRHALTDYWKELAAGRDSAMKITRSATTKQVVIHFAALVRDKQGKPFRVVVSRMPVGSIYEIVEQAYPAEEDGENAKVELLDREGLILYSSYNQKGILKEASSDWEYLKDLVSPDRRTGSVRHAYSDDEELSAFAMEQGYRNFTGNGWILVLCTSVDTAFKPVHAQTKKLAYAFTLICCLVLATTFATSRSMMRPLKKIADAASEIGKGNLDVRVKSSPQDEIGQLAQAFNAMAGGLKESEGKFKNLAELLPQIVFETDVKSNFTFANQHVFEISGYTQEDIVKGLKAFQLFVPEDRSRAYDNFYRRLRGDSVGGIEYTVMRKEGSTFPILLYADPIMREDRAAGLRGIAIDITERKVTEKMLRIQHELVFRLSTLTGLNDGLRVSLDAAIRATGMDSGGIYLVDAVSGAVDLHCHNGLSPDIVRSISHLEPGSDKARIIMAGQPLYLLHPQLKTAMSGPEVRENLHFLAIVPFKHEDRVIGCLNIASHSLDTAPPYAREVLETITAQIGNVIVRLKAEEELRVSEGNYRNLAEKIGELIYRADPETFAATYVNSVVEHFYGYTPKEWLSDPNAWGTRIYADDREATMRAFSDARRELKNIVITYRILSRDQTMRWVEDRVSWETDNQGKAISMNGIVYDITERRRAEDRIYTLNEELDKKVEERTQQLLEAQEELIRKEKLSTLGQIAGSVGHELRNPLGVMSNAVYYLQTTLADADESVREYLGIIKSEIFGAERIVSDLLDAVRTKSPQPQGVSAEDLVRTSLEKCRIAEGISVEVSSETDTPMLVDPLQMRQVFVNLINNAADAMLGGGALRIRVRALKDGGRGTKEARSVSPAGETGVHPASIEITVADTGSGISPENMKKLFQPLFTTKARGIGLGLVVVKNLVEANNGMISVESRVGEGTTFRLTVPSEEV